MQVGGQYHYFTLAGAYEAPANIKWAVVVAVHAMTQVDSQDLIIYTH